MSLDPREHQRRGRSRSPGRERERSKVRAPSPPSQYEYEEQTSRSMRPSADVVSAEPRYKGNGGWDRETSPLRDSYSIPGAFDSEGEEQTSKKEKGGSKQYQADVGYGGGGRGNYKNGGRGKYEEAYDQPRSERQKYEVQDYEQPRSERSKYDQDATYGYGKGGKDDYDHKRTSKYDDAAYAYGKKDDYEKARSERPKYPEQRSSYGYGKKDDYEKPKPERPQYSQPHDSYGYGKKDDYDTSKSDRPQYTSENSYQYSSAKEDYERKYREKMEQEAKRYAEKKPIDTKSNLIDATGKHSMSGALGYGHEQEKSQRPPVPAGYPPPPVNGYAAPSGYAQPSSGYVPPIPATLASYAQPSSSGSAYPPAPAGYAPPVQGGYSAPPGSQSYASSGPHGVYSAPSPPSAYAAPPPTGSYGAPPNYPSTSSEQYPPTSGTSFAYPSTDPPEGGRHPALPSYMEPKQWEYAKPDENITFTKRTESYNTRPASPPKSQYAAKPEVKEEKRSSRHSKSYVNESARSSASNVVTVEPGSRRRREKSPDPNLAYGGPKKETASSSLGPRMHSLSVSTGNHGSATLSLANAPGSPLLEAYHGTYQSLPPMPSPLMIANHAHGDHNILEAISPLTSDDEGRPKKTRRNARFHDPQEEAIILAKALKGTKRGPDTGPLIEILPGLTHEQVLELRVEYKKIVKTGSEKKGVNIAKHIKMQLKEEDPSLMKACYACALGKWESEAYWSNFWYQGEKSRRELLIESLFGRTNREIRAIKDGFSDKKYSDSLTKCMRTELKEDKFKKAVMMVLDEKKMEDSSRGLDRDLVHDDVLDLYKAVKSEKGGESSIISIVVMRSDTHMREVLRLYEGKYRANFAREMLKKSGNLVGEMLAHILNGVINKPVRDALLLKHALQLSKSDSIRTELLISRLVRFHWDRPHMEAVRREFRVLYGEDLQIAVREGTRGDWGRFCEMLCVRRMGDEVRRVERVEIHEEYDGGRYRR